MIIITSLVFVTWCFYFIAVPYSSYAFKFQFPPEMRREDLVKATLGIYLRRHPSTQYSNQSTRIVVQQVVRSGVKVIDSLPIQINDASIDRWYRFDVLSDVRKWLQIPSVNLGLVVTFDDNKLNSLVVVDPIDPDVRQFVSEQVVFVSNSTPKM